LPNQIDFSPRKKRWLDWQQRKKKNKNRRRPLLLPKQLDAGKMVHDDENNDKNTNMNNTNTNTTNRPSTLFLLSVETVEEETLYF